MKNNSKHLVLVIVSLLMFTTTFNCQTKDENEKSEAWFTVKQIYDKVWRIDDHGGDNMYLVEGDEKALLIDTGTGVADLKKCVKSITNLPLIIINTHGHPDHAGGNFQFKEVYAHPEDFELIGFFCNENYHGGAVKQVIKDSPGLASFILKDVDNFAPAKLLPVKEGYVFDLGNRKLKVIEVPGHTMGSICLLDAENKLLFTGDNNNTLVWLFLDGCLPLESYMHTLEKQKKFGDFEIMIPGHGEPIDRGFIDEQIMCIKNILDGTCQGEPYKTFVDYAKVCSYKRARVAYNPDNLRE